MDFIDIRLLAPLATCLAICVTICLWILNQRHKRLSYQVLFRDALSNARGAAKDKLSITFDGQPVENADLILIRVQNNGHVTITAGDYVSKLTIDMGPGAEILMADVIETQPADLEQRCKSIIENVGKQQVTLAPLLLNEKDTLTIQLLVRNARAAIKVTGHVSGIRRIQEWKHKPVLPAILSNAGAVTMAGAVLLIEPSNIIKFGIMEAIPFILCFLLGYLLLSAGLYWNHRDKPGSIRSRQASV